MTGTELGASAAFYDGKRELYKDFHNWDLLRVVRHHLRPGGSVLDIGCASGGLLHLLEPLAGFRAGLELSPDATRAAAEVADQVICGGIDDPEVSFAPASFDVVVCGDVLEHVAEPAAALGRACGWTAPGGAVVVCVPNVANWQARLRLLRGVWRYETAGLWDSGHLRFFTLGSVEALMEEAGLLVEALEATQALDHQLPRLSRHAPVAAMRAVERTVDALARARPQLFAFQLICVGRPSTEDR